MLGLSSSIHFWPEYLLDCQSVEEALVINADQRPRFLSQLDRDVYESIPVGMQEVVAAHEVWDICPRHLRPEVISRKTGCTITEAIQLADALAILNADDRLAREIYRWARIRGAEATLRFLHKFLVGIAEAENPPEDPESEQAPLIGFQEIRPVSEMDPEDIVEELKARGFDGCSGSGTPLDEMSEDELRTALIKMDQAEAEPEYSVAETIEYHRLGDNGEEDWISRQPLWFQKLITTVQECKEIKALKGIGKSVFASNLTGDRASVFWGFYNARKRYLESRQVVRTFAVKFIQRIHSAKDARELAGIGRNLYKLQRGEIKGPQLRDDEWKTIWAAYHEAKAHSLKAAA